MRDPDTKQTIAFLMPLRAAIQRQFVPQYVHPSKKTTVIYWARLTLRQIVFSFLSYAAVAREFF